MDWRGYVILAISLGVPLALLLHRREKELFAWLCLTVGVNIFDARVGINFPAARLVGLLVIPFLPLGAFDFQSLIRTRPMRILLIGTAYLAILGIVYGFIYPWPNVGFLRPWVQSAQGRVLIYAARLLSDFGIILLVARQLLRGTRPHEVMRLLLIGTSAAVVGALVEFVTNVQVYQLLTGFPINEIGGRVRGLNFEPRGLGLTMVQGGFIAFLWSRVKRSRFLAMLAAAHFVVLVLAVSASALIAAAAGWLCLVIFERRVRRPLLGAGALAAGAFVLLLLVGPDLPLTQIWSTSLAERFTVRQAVDLATRTPIEVFARFLDIFDYTAFMVLTSSPLAAIIGVGPGLVMLPGSAFIPEDPRWAWVVETNEGITSLPLMGVLLEWANGGIVMLVFWVLFVVACSRALATMAELEPEHADSWWLGRAAFVVIAGTYLVQASPISAIWPLFMGIGIGAAALALESVPRPALATRLAFQGGE
ncbi:MAG TPA: hypothetical protein VIG08_15790 [Gemmatimonadales bacterium]|jgi:hypothetical protein